MAPSDCCSKYSVSEFTSMIRTDWHERCRERKQRQRDSIPLEWLIQAPTDSQLNVMDVPKTCGLLHSPELEITNAPIDVLLSNLASGHWTCVDVTTAFYKRAIVAHQLTNCLTEIFVSRALERAKFLDTHLKDNGKPMGPLHGLPISLKDQFSLKGLETIMGYVGWIGQPAEDDCVLAKILNENGANLFLRTNVPQTLAWGETYNHVFGRTSNPYNRQCTSGGSSGGEGALLALKGSPLGVGTDMGGSVRIPSALCGLYALRPSYGRLPYEGARDTAEGQESIRSVLGPMANSLEACRIFTKVILDACPWSYDPMCLRKPWDQAAYELRDHGRGDGMCFAIIRDNKVVRPHPPVARALEMAKIALKAAGHKVIEWAPYRHEDIYHNAQSIWAADGSNDYQRHCELSGEPLLKKEDFTTEQSHRLYSQLTSEFSKPAVGASGSLTSNQLWQFHKERQKLRKEYLDHWNSTVAETGTGRPVDAIISPVLPYGMPPHGLHMDASYTAVWNSLDYPSAVFPVTTVDVEMDKALEERTEFYNHKDKAIHKLYDSELFRNSPIGLQVVCRTQEEEAVLAMAQVIVDALHTSQAASSFGGV